MHILLFCTQSCSLALLGIIFFVNNTFDFFLFFGLVPLAGRISGGLEKITFN